MIHLISDLHGGKDIGQFKEYVSTASFDDLLIILGDTELNFQDTEENRCFTEYFLSTNKPIAIVDGNHENHPYIRSFPRDTMYGGPVYRLSDSIVYLKRGNVYTIEGKTFFVMGGCKSSAKWFDMGLVYDFEDPSAEEIAFGIKNLNRHNNKVDYILTHKYKSGEGELATKNSLQYLTNYIDENVSFTHWYSGHWHKTVKLDGLHTVIYNEIVTL